MIAILPSGLDKLLWERLSKKGEEPEGDWLNYTIKSNGYMNRTIDYWNECTTEAVLPACTYQLKQSLD